MIDSHHVLPRFYRCQEALEAQRKIDAILLETGEPAPLRVTADATAAGDSIGLRGVPVIGRGVGGTSPGSDPLGALMRKQPDP